MLIVILPELVVPTALRTIANDNRDADEENDDARNEHDHLVVAESSTGTDVNRVSEQGDGRDRESGQHQCNAEHTL